MSINCDPSGADRTADADADHLTGFVPVAGTSREGVHATAASDIDSKPIVLMLHEYKGWIGARAVAWLTNRERRPVRNAPPCNPGESALEYSVTDRFREGFDSFSRLAPQVGETESVAGFDVAMTQAFMNDVARLASLNAVAAVS